MPYRLDPDDSRCVQVEDDDGDWARIDGGCHQTAEEAQAHLTALNLNVEHKRVTKWVGEIAKVDEPRRVVYGYAYKAIDADGTVLLDHSEEFMDDPQNLEDAVVDYVLHSREGDVMHTGDPTSILVESMVFTPEKAAALGVEGLPQLAWWVGYKIVDETVWEKVQSGDLAMFSIAGTAEVEEVEEV